MATITEILSPVWTYSIDGGGAIVEGMAAINQCLDLIIRTTKGTDPLRPEFGSMVYQYADKPVNEAIPAIKKAILDAVATWEARVLITTISHSIITDNPELGSQLVFNVSYRLKDGTLNDSLLLFINNGGISSGVTKNRLILQGFFPPNPQGYQYQVIGALDSNSIVPTPPVNGFASPFDLFTWVKENWVNYGQWYLNSESIVGYIIPSFSNGALTITLLNVKKFFGVIPSMQIGSKYSVTVTIDNAAFSNDIDLFTAEQIRVWAQGTVTNQGEWKIDLLPGSFNDDFNDDFEVYSQALAIYTDQAQNVSITITTIPQ